MPTDVDIAFSLWVLLQQARDAMYNARDKELSKYDISPREAATLHAIILIGKSANPTKLARWSYRKPHTIAGILTRMQKNNLITLNKDVDIKNIVRIKVTEKGKRIYKLTQKRDIFSRIFGVLDEKQSHQLETYLGMIRDKALSEIGDSINRPIP